MRYKITLILILLFITTQLLTSDIFNYGFDKSIESISITKNYFLEIPFEMDNKILLLGDEKTLFIGFIYYSFISCSSIIIAFSLRFYEGSNQKTAIKSFLAFLMISLSIISIFSAILNFTEYSKISVFKKILDKPLVKEIDKDYNLSLEINKLITIKNINNFYEKNAVINVEMLYNKIRISKLKTNKSSNYKKMMKERYKYKINFKSEKNITIKQSDVVVLKYNLSGLYNIDYIARVNGETFVINFTFEEDNIQNDGVINDFFVNSFNIQRG